MIAARIPTYHARHAKPRRGVLGRLADIVAAVLLLILSDERRGRRRPPMFLWARESSHAEELFGAWLSDHTRGLRKGWTLLPVRHTFIFAYPGEPIGCWNKRHDSVQPALIRPYMRRLANGWGHP
ncbi:hypothetical protein HNR23_000340 [Nocardiopsis mwathae]|uniref:Uncharacterized protein n=1 Tax=Nocardiopsis mwathae TaxID=1472723 RepID=A0A7W9YE78_9ACTN|nr:hypothetical protein [Nocardiopsis mwathae]MBB6170280.1 hypothetical protein [Nocardiopsis mwathae]